jgi:hypothetical protein
MSLHNRPTAAELVAAVEEFLRHEVMTATEGRLQFQARVAANALAIVGRELALGAEDEAAHVARLAGLGMADDAELAAAIRDGRMDDRFGELIAVLSDAVAAKLAVAIPHYAAPGES